MALAPNCVVKSSADRIGKCISGAMTVPLERGGIQVVSCEGVRPVRHLKCLKVRYTGKGNDCLFQVHRVKAESDAEAVQPDGLTRSKKPRSGPRPTTETSRSG